MNCRFQCVGYRNDIARLVSYGRSRSAKRIDRMSSTHLPKTKLDLLVSEYNTRSLEALVIFFVIVAAGLCVAYANGSNDNFKGVATLFGSGTTNYKKALFWATACTFAGSVAAMMLAGKLIKAFGGKGLIDDTIAGQPAFAAAVGVGTAVTIFVATKIGMPVSTTHGLIGSLIGTGLVAGSSLNVATLGSKFLIPLIASPLLAVVATSAIYPILRFVRRRLGVESNVCICVGQETVELVPDGSLAMGVERAAELSLALGETAICESRYQGSLFGLSAGKALDALHFLSSGVLSFARGLNDTPKIAALLLLAPAIGVPFGLVIIGLMIAIGGLISARAVAETMSKKITPMNHGQGFTANVVSAFIVIFASNLGLPVSTTHVSCGAIFGLGATTGNARKKTVIAILLAWVCTLPMAAAIAAISYKLLVFTA